MRKSLIFFLNILILSVVWTGNVVAQTPSVDSLVAAGDALREEYRFEESVSVYRKALEYIDGPYASRMDSSFRETVNDKILLSENGKNMAGFVFRPKVVAKHKFSLEDFFLYYPLKDRSWRAVPNCLDSLSGPYARAIYVPSESDVIHFSMPDNDGIRNVCRTVFKDSIWTLPSLLNEQLTSAADEIYPMVSEDGKHLYFASDGLYGVGGYDIYVSEWDESAGDWSVPVNMGFPYSSPANDFLFVNSPDGKYTLFASDRETSKDSVYVYVLEHDSMPVRGSVDRPSELAEICRLEPLGGLESEGMTMDVKSEIPENVDTRRYMERMADVRALRDSIALCEDDLEDSRERYSMTESDSEKRKLTDRILEIESLIPGFQQRLDEAVRKLQEVEMDFLFRGVVIDPDKLLVEAEREIVSETPDYVFSRMDMGEPLTLEMEKPEPKFDYSFKILDKGQFAEDNTIPGGIVYQVQIFSISSPATVRNLKGLSPVFESRSSSGRYIYRAGLFRTYSDVLAKLNKIKRLGFKSAFIVGYVDGKEMQVKKVRAIEEERRKAAPSLYKVSVIPNEDLDDVSMEGIRQQSGGRDIARTERGLVIGPFDDMKAASALVDFIKVMGYGEAKLETITH